MASLNYGISIQVDGGPQIAVTKSLTVQAHDSVNVTIDPGGTSATAVTVDVQPSVAEQVVMMLIRSSLYGPELTYKVSDGGTDGPEIALTEPQFFLGGSVALLGVAPKQLKFKNTFATGDSTKKAVIEVFVGRDATPAPAPAPAPAPNPNPT